MTTDGTDDPDEHPPLDAIGLDALERYADLGRPEFDLADVARTSGLDLEALETFWRALGFPEAREHEKQLSARRRRDALRRRGPHRRRIARSPTRRCRWRGSSARRSIGWRRPRSTPSSAGSTARRSGTEREELRRTLDLAGLMPPVLEFVWRRQLAAAARRRLLRTAVPGEAPPVCVGFADLVGFTAQTQQLDQAELALVVGRFESIAYDVVARHGGRVVKTIGDEVMFLTDDAEVAAAVALDLARTYRDDPDLSDVRVGLALGPVLERDGDIYGHTVNLASRIVSVAYPGSVVVSGELYDALVEHEDFEFTSLRNHYLKDIGRVPLWRLRRTGDEVDGPYRAARENRRTRGRILEERWRERDRELRARTTGELSALLAGRVDDLPERVAHVLSGSAPPEVVQQLVDDPTAEELSALADLVLGAGLDADLEIDLLTDIGSAPALRRLDREANQRGGRDGGRGRATTPGDRDGDGTAHRRGGARCAAEGGRGHRQGRAGLAQGRPGGGQADGEGGGRGPPQGREGDQGRSPTCRRGRSSTVLIVTV